VEVTQSIQVKGSWPGLLPLTPRPMCLRAPGLSVWPYGVPRILPPPLRHCRRRSTCREAHSGITHWRPRPSTAQGEASSSFIVRAAHVTGISGVCLPLSRASAPDQCQRSSCTCFQRSPAPVCCVARWYAEDFALEVGQFDFVNEWLPGSWPMLPSLAPFSRVLLLLLLGMVLPAQA